VKTTTSHISANIRFHVTGDVANISATMRSVHKCNKKGIMTSTVTLSIFSVIGRLSCQVHSSRHDHDAGILPPRGIGPTNLGSRLDIPVNSRQQIRQLGTRPDHPSGESPALTSSSSSGASRISFL
jgi:hypothetical protein